MASLDKYKLTQNTWDSDTQPGKLIEFLTLLGSMVRSIVHGPLLEDYLDMKLGRFRHSHVTTPSYFMEDPDFSDPSTAKDPGAAAEASDTASVSTGPSSSGESKSSDSKSTSPSQSMGSQSLNHAGSYWDLSPEARDLDSLLYNVLRMCVKGSKRVLLECVQFPSYIQGVVVLMRHHDISRNDRIYTGI